MPRKNAPRFASALLLLISTVTPAVAAEGIIRNGIDLWRTPGNGSSWTDFAEDPIPAGFFCSESEPFEGRIFWRGLPIVTSPPGALGDADTVIRRLDDATFDPDGIATTRVQVTAMSFVGIDPIETSCGAFEARVRLAPGKQPS